MDDLILIASGIGRAIDLGVAAIVFILTATASLIWLIVVCLRMERSRETPARETRVFFAVWLMTLIFCLYLMYRS